MVAGVSEVLILVYKVSGLGGGAVLLEQEDDGPNNATLIHAFLDSPSSVIILSRDLSVLFQF
jgi:hypothetical protein